MVYKSHTEGIVRATREKVWEIFRGFGKSTLQFWSILKDVELHGDDEVGVERTVITSTGQIQERLEVRDDDTFTLAYSFISMTPNPGLISALTTFTMTEEEGGKTTKVCVDAEYEASNLMIANAIRNRFQTASHLTAITGLDRLLNSIVGHVTISHLSAHDLPKMDSTSSADPFIRISIIDDEGNRTSCHTTPTINNCSNPNWRDEIMFPLEATFSRIHFEVYDKDVFSRDDFIFGGEIDAEDIKNQVEEKTDETIKISDENSPATLTFKATFVLIDGAEMGDIKVVAMLEERQRALEFVHFLGAIRLQIQSVLVRFVQTPHHKMEFEKFKFQQLDCTEYPGVSNVIPIDRMLKPHIFAKILERILTTVYSFSGEENRREELGNRWISNFNPDYIPMPPTVKNLAENWKNDHEFVRQFLQGINPFIIRKVESLQELSDIGCDMVSLTVPDEGVDVAELIASGRLLIADYHFLSTIEGNEPTSGGFYRSPDLKNIYYAPFALFHTCEEENLGHNVKVLGIQLTRFTDKPNRIFTPKNKENVWLYAKMAVQSADVHVMQFVNHLGLSHFSVEPMAIAYHNWRFDLGAEAETKPVLQLLQPHMDNAVGINWLARQSLVLEQAPVLEKFFATGTANGMRMMKAALANKQWDDLSFKSNMAKRGFSEHGDDGVKGYYYRDDGFLLWNALHKYATIAVDAAYEDDDGVIADEGLQQFISEIADPTKGNLSAFRLPGSTSEDWRPMEVSTKEFLVEVLTTMIYQASAFHAAQNNAEFEYISFCPNKPHTLSMPMPELEDDEDIPWEKIERSLPDYLVSAFQILISYILTAETSLALGQVTSLKELVPDAHESLMESFEEMKTVIDERNDFKRRQGEITYEYFLPEKCNASVDI